MRKTLTVKKVNLKRDKKDKYICLTYGILRRYPIGFGGYYEESDEDIKKEYLNALNKQFFKEQAQIVLNV